MPAQPPPGAMAGIVSEALSGIAFEMRTWLRLLVPGSGYVAPYYPTPDSVIQRMLTLAQVGPGDVLFDLGCGDGRVLAAAAARGARGVGYELDAALAARAQQCLRAEGLDERAAHVVVGDAAKADVSEATVIALYLSDMGNAHLLRAVAGSLRPGTRVVSFTFAVAGWEAQLVAADRQDNLPVFLYTAP